jgi:hypothetical protein
MCGPQVGTGKVSVADWWLRIAWVEEEESEAAAAPAITTDNAKMRTASFMMSYSFRNLVRALLKS